MTFDEWMLTKDKSYVPTDDSMSLRLLRECWFSRDAEVVSLTNQRDYEYVRAENAEHDRLLVKIEIAAKDAEIAELVAALEHILAGSLSLPRFAEAEAIAVIAKVRKP